MIATQDVGELRFVTDGTFATSGTLMQTTAPVQVGYVPQAGSAFKALLKAANGVDIDTAASTRKFIATAGLSVVTGADTKTIASSRQSFSFADLLGAGAAFSGGTAIDVGAEKLLPAKLKLAVDASGSVARLGGTLNFAALGGSGFSLDTTTSFVTAGLGDSLKATLADGLSLRGDFAVGGTSFRGSLKVHQYDSSTDTLGLSGTSSFTVGSNTFDIQVGSNAAAGLTVNKGKLTSYAFTTTSAFSIGAAKFTTKGLSAAYDTTKSAFNLKGAASVTFSDNNNLSIDLGGKATDGLVYANGKLSKLDFAATGAVTLGSSSLKLDALAGKYTQATDVFELSGGASLTLGSQNVAVVLGGNNTAGLIFTKGSVSAAGGVLNADLSVGGASLKATGLTTNYIPATRTLAINGDAALAIGGTTLAVKLGSKAEDGAVSQGLLVEGSKVSALDAVVTGGFTLAGTTYKADGLHIVYAPGDGSYKVDGRAAITITANDKPSTLTATFGTAAAPGLVLSDGSVQKLDFTADGSLTVGGTNLTTKSLKVTRDTTTGALTATGNAALTVGKTTIDVKLGSTSAEGIQSTGLVILDGSLQALDAAVTGGFTVAGVSFKADALRFVWARAQDLLNVNGKATLSFKAGGKVSSLAATFGDDKSAGLIIGGGSLQKLDVIADGTLNISGLALTAKALNFTRDASGNLTAKGALGVTLGEAKLEVELGQKDSAGIVIEEGELKTLDAAVTSEFSFSGVKFSTKSLRLEWANVDGLTAYEITGEAAAAFTAAGKTTSLAVGFGTKGQSGLRIVDGKFAEATMKLSGEAAIAGLTIKADDLTMSYKPSLGTFIMFGGLEVSAGSGKVINRVKATLGKSYAAPGIELQSGTLNRLDLAVDGKINLGPLSAAANNLRIAYRRSDDLVTVSGGVAIGIAGGTLSAALPENGLRINTATGDVTLNGLSMKAGGFSVGAVEIKNINLNYKDDGNGNVGYAGGLSMVVSGSETGASFEASFVNNQLSGMALAVQGSFRIGSMVVTRFNAGVTGLETGGSLQITGGVTAVIPGTKNVNLLTINGSVLVNSKVFELKGDAYVFNRSLLEGQATVRVDFEAGTFDFNGNMRGLGGAIEGNATLRFAIATGYFDAQANLRIKIPDSVRLVGGTELGSASIQVKYGPETTYTTQAVLPASIRQIGRNDNRTTISAGERLNKGDVRFSPDGSYKLVMQDDGNLVYYNVPMNRAAWATGARGDYAVMQSDGNLVLYSGTNAVWSSNTFGNAGASFALQNDGNLVVYAADNRALWNAGSQSNENARLVAMVIKIAGETDAGTRDRLTRDAVSSGLYGHISFESLAALVESSQVRRGVATSSRFLKLSGSASAGGVGGTASYIANLDTNTYKATLGYESFIKSGVVDIASNGDPRTLPEFVVLDELPTVATVTPMSLASVSRASLAPAAASSNLLQAGNPFARTSVGAAFDPSIIASDLRAMTSTANAPVARISGVSFDGTRNAANIKYVVTSASPASVSIYVDTDAKGYDGYQIDSGLVAKAGTQAFTYADVAKVLPADALNGAKLYFYVKVNNSVHAPVYSSYSSGMAVKNTQPTVTVPTDLQYASIGTPLKFSDRFFNAITITDPLAGLKNVSASDKSLTVEVDTEGEGTVKIFLGVRGVTVQGNGTEWLTLTGQAADLNRVLQTLTYTPFTGAGSDTMFVDVRRTNSIFKDRYIERDIDIEVDDITIQGFDDETFFSSDGKFYNVLPKIWIHDPYSDVVSSLKVALEGYERGVDKLRINNKGLNNIYRKGISTKVDESAGTITFSGGSMTMGMAVLLLRQLQYASTAPAGKELVITLQNGTVDFSEIELRLVY